MGLRCRINAFLIAFMLFVGRNNLLETRTSTLHVLQTVLIHLLKVIAITIYQSADIPLSHFFFWF